MAATSYRGQQAATEDEITSLLGGHTSTLPQDAPSSASSSGAAPTDTQITLDNLNDDKKYKFPQSNLVMALTGMFYLLCITTGQYVNFEVFNNYCLSGEMILSQVLTSATVLFALACFVVLNVFAVGFDVYVVSTCALSLNCGYIYHFSPVQMTNVSHGLQLTAPQMNQVNDWNKVVVTSATLSGALSYLFMVFVLYGRYIPNCKACYKGTDCLLWIIENTFGRCDTRLHSQPEYHKDFSKPNPNELVINPFVDDEYMVGDNLKDIVITDKGEGRGAGGDRKQNQYVSSLLTSKQSICFQFTFWFNFCVYTASVGIFVWILVGQLDLSNAILEGLDLAGLIAQFVSQFSALISCFIFSKVAYAVSNRCIDFSKCIFQVANIPRVTKNDREEEIETDDWRNLKTGLGFSAEKKVDHLTVLKAMDQRYMLMLKNSLSPFGLWFTVHWVLYTLTAFMSIAYVADEIIMELYGTEPQDVKCHWEKDLDCVQSLAYTMLFALFHCILFLYPCFRAASVTKARKNMIKSVSREEWSEISLTEKEAFVTYLERQNASFKISVLCTRLTFGFELASLSIIIGVFGVVMKLSF